MVLAKPCDHQFKFSLNKPYQPWNVLWMFCPDTNDNIHTIIASLIKRKFVRLVAEPTGHRKKRNTSHYPKLINFESSGCSVFSRAMGSEERSHRLYALCFFYISTDISLRSIIWIYAKIVSYQEFSNQKYLIRLLGSSAIEPLAPSMLYRSVPWTLCKLS